MKIYLAARYSRRREMLEFGRQLEEDGHTIVSRWISGVHEDHAKEQDNSYTEEDRALFGAEDFRDLRSAECLVQFTEEPRSHATRGGHYVEFGVALASGVLPIVVGYRVNNFHYMEGVFFVASKEEVRALLTLPAVPIPQR